MNERSKNGDGLIGRLARTHMSRFERYILLAGAVSAIILFLVWALGGRF